MNNAKTKHQEWVLKNKDRVVRYRVKYEQSAKGQQTKKKYRQKNKTKIEKRRKEWRAKNPHKSKEYFEKYKKFFPEKLEKKNFQSRIALSSIDMTFEEYKTLKRNHKGVCAICGLKNKSKRELSIDHSHKTGKPRGLLCGKCNLGIGLLLDSPRLLEKAIKYLRKYK